MTAHCKRSGLGDGAVVRLRCVRSTLVVAAATRGTGPAGALVTEESLDHDQANPARPDDGGLARRRGRRVQHAGRQRRPVRGCAGRHQRPVRGRSGWQQRPIRRCSIDRAVRGSIHRAVRLGCPIGRPELLVGFRSTAPRISGSGALFLVCPKRAATPRCNARASRRTACGGPLQCVELNALCRLRRCREENLQVRGDRGPWSIRDPSRGRPSRDAALAETTTSAAPHLTVRAGRLANRIAADRRMQRGSPQPLSILCDGRPIIHPAPILGSRNRTYGMEVLTP